MSRLEYFSRPLVAFDAKNKEHRRFYFEFVKSHSWGKCPVRFIVPEESGWDLISMIQRQLLEFYVHKEFDREVKPEPIVKKKARKVK